MILNQGVDIHADNDIIFYHAILNYMNEHFIDIFKLVLQAMDKKIPTIDDVTFKNRNILTRGARTPMTHENHALITSVLTGSILYLKSHWLIWKDVYNYDGTIYKKYKTIIKLIYPEPTLI